MSKNGFVWKCWSKIPWTILLPFNKLPFSSGYPYGISQKNMDQTQWINATVWVEIG